MTRAPLKVSHLRGEEPGVIRRLSEGIFSLHFQAAVRAGALDPGAPEQGVPQDLDPAPSLSVAWSNVPGISALSSFVSLSVVPSLSLCLEKVMILPS